MPATLTSGLSSVLAPDRLPAADATWLSPLSAADGTRLMLRRCGIGLAGAPVVMLHGLQSHSGWFVGSQLALARAGHPVYAPDRRGAGLSAGARGDCERFTRLLDDVRVVCDQARRDTGASRVHLMGHCFGALPALLAAAALQDQLASLILASPACYTLARPSLPQRLRIGLSLLIGGGARLPIPYPDAQLTDDPHWLAAIRADPLALGAVTARFLYQIHLARKQLPGAVDRLRLPVFSALAGGDRICDNKKNRALLAPLADAQHQQRLYPAARHILEYSPDMTVFLQDLIEWMRAHSHPERPHAH